MENASKALIIAGAILIAILLISVGIMVMNSVNKPIDQSKNQADAQAVEMFNSKFTGYVGSQSAASVKSLLTSVAASNATNTNHQITLTTTAATGNGLTARTKTTGQEGAAQAQIMTQYTYTVTFTYTSGYITDVAIK
ncbi:MAG: hypothetical protein FWC53_04370 [Firmicutes bacterium]|nr:hypothetical protein [Bacillota bacterium]